MNFTCATCGDIVGGRAEHCTVCHRTFTGTSTGDLHRTGQHGVKDGPDRRRCRTDDELAKHGIVRKSNGRWGHELGDAKWWDEA